MLYVRGIGGAQQGIINHPDFHYRVAGEQGRSAVDAVIPLPVRAKLVPVILPKLGPRANKAST